MSGGKFNCWFYESYDLMALDIKRHVINCDMLASQAVEKLNEFDWFGCFLITAYKNKYFLIDDSDIRRGLIKA